MPDGIHATGAIAMHAVPLTANPFALLTDPETVFRAVESSPRLEGLNRRICRPLDRAARGEDDGAEASSSDVAIVRDVERYLD
jgi:hypothetical protein